LRPSLIAGAVAGAVLLAACGGGSSSADVEDFCSEYKEVEDQLAQLDDSDPDAVDALFDHIDDLDPPDEISDDFRAMTEFNRMVYSASQDVDLDDPDAAAEFQERFSEQAEDLDEASGKVNDYLSEHCDIAAAD
jgi:outer membrane murein-binding lipoprotein Lpp